MSAIDAEFLRELADEINEGLAVLALDPEGIPRGYNEKVERLHRIADKMPDSDAVPLRSREGMRRLQRQLASAAVARVQHDGNGVEGLSDPETTREATAIADEMYRIVKLRNATRGAALHALMMISAEVIRQHANPKEALPAFLEANRLYVEAILKIVK